MASRSTNLTCGVLPPLPAAAWPSGNTRVTPSPTDGQHAVRSVFAAAGDRCAGGGTGDAAVLVAADDALWPPGGVAVLRFSRVGPLFGLPAGAARLGLRSVCQLRAV